MSAVTLPGPRTVIAPPLPPSPKRWTVTEFHQLWEEGWFEGHKAMLVNGEILVMANPGNLHNRGVGLAEDELRKAFGEGYWVRVQMPLVLSQRSDPVPDLAVVIGTPRTLIDQPTSALLVVEVADTSLATDLGEKAMAYALAGIADYWVTDVNQKELIVHRNPQPDRTNALGASYANVTTFVAGQTISPLAAPGATIAVSDLMP